MVLTSPVLNLKFLKFNGIHHIKTAPYHPASNGLAEQAVQTFKSGMKKLTSGTLETRVARFSSTTESPRKQLLVFHHLNCYLAVVYAAT